jgi:hypothetical protein
MLPNPNGVRISGPGNLKKKKEEKRKKRKKKFGCLGNQATSESNV